MRDVTIVVPTYNESENIARFVETVSRSLVGVDWEIVFVDDNSPDQTARVVHSLAESDPRLAVLVRSHKRGLTSAVLDGLGLATGRNVVVTDADLQHDLSRIPLMLKLLDDPSGPDVVVGTRYSNGGRQRGLADGFRVFLSSFATLIAKLLLGVRLSDPMSGFFALRRVKTEPFTNKIEPIGFKVLLDLYLYAGKALKFSEIPYTFQPRLAGESKLDWRIQWDFFVQVIYHRLWRILPYRFISFFLVGGTGAVFHFITLYSVLNHEQTNFMLAQGAAVTVATVWNFTLNHILTFHQPAELSRSMLLKFALYSIAVGIGIALNIGAAQFTFEIHKVPIAIASAAGVAVDMIWRFAVAQSIIWSESKW